MTDKKQLGNRKNVRHQGYDGQKAVGKQKKMSIIKAMTDKKQLGNRKNVRHQIGDGHKTI
jgi:hypothetical protein